MRQSKLFSKIKKEAPREAEAISHKLLLRGDFIDQLSSGVYSLLPLGYRCHQNIISIIREEMQGIGAQEVFLPSLQPKAIWTKSGRWDTINPPLFKLKDSHKKVFALGSTHEEVITKIVKPRLHSYKDLPITLFQFQTKFRNEIRCTGGLLRTKEFVMKDLYSFHRNEEDFEKYYEKVAKAYLRIFKRCGLQAKRVKASGLGFTKSFTDEFQVLTPVGEDTIIFCPKCSFAQNKEVTTLRKGDKCPKCGARLQQGRGIEVGNIFPLGTKYPDSFGLYFVDKDGRKKLPVMGSYGIGVERLLATIVEIHHDERGIVWPDNIAPYKIHLIPVDIKNRKIRKTAETLYKKLSSTGQNSNCEVLYDDREAKSIGEKFVEADLIGIPWRVVISERNLGKNKIEIKRRSQANPRLISPKNILSVVKC